MGVEVVKFTIFGVSLFLMFFLSKYLVESLTHFSKKLRVSEFMVGSIVLAIGTSLPEIIDALIASTLSLGELGMGIIVGSNISNILLILSMSVLIKPISKISKPVLKESYLLLLITLVFVLFCLDGQLSRFEGFMLLASYAGYHWFLHKKDMHAGGMVYVKEIQADIILTPIAIFTIIICGWLVVNTGASIAEDLSIPLSFFGLIIIAVTTSLPELSSSLISAKKGHYKMVIGNIFGSNAANLLLAAGIASLVRPMVFASSNVLAFSILSLLVITSLITFVMHTKKRVSRKMGSIMLFCYVIYLIFVSIFGGAV
ncbi:MAG: sodium:calcium antiporter [Nanoarchaeota archaeon]|nr:sodium:calcium antiporter [Nanoarchaeota archaeon]